MHGPFDDDEWENEHYGPSRSQKKRDAEALHELGKKLAELDPHVLDKMDLPDDVLQAIAVVRPMQFGARKRQLKFIAGLLRKLDTGSIEATIAGIEDRKGQIDSSFHLCEHWRDRMLGGDADAVTEFMETYPGADATQLRQLIRNARQEHLQNKPPRSARQLFQIIRQIIA